MGYPEYCAIDAALFGTGMVLATAAPGLFDYDKQFLGGVAVGSATVLLPASFAMFVWLLSGGVR